MTEKPEHLAPPEIFYYEDEARNTRIILVQMCERAIELLALPEDEKSFILDIGCGSGLSGSVLEVHARKFTEFTPITLGLALTIAVIRETKAFE